MKYRQYELRSGDSVLICWLETDARLVVGARLTLKAIPDREWRVSIRYSNERDEPPITDWRVGGLL